MYEKRGAEDAAGAASPAGTGRGYSSDSACAVDRRRIRGGPTPDDSAKFDGNVPFSVVPISEYALQFMVGGAMGPGSSWAVARQPNWIGPDVAAPQAGVFA
ncbi:MAG TPA: hypothetical protein VEA69_08530 [Tepidisphaeraceae bacterium]|nr:hypothetical protein [Tepidisphaeraceae bacterium]